MVPLSYMHDLFCQVVVFDVEVILKFIIDASSTQLYMLSWRVSPANFVEQSNLMYTWTHSLLLQVVSY